MSEQNWWAQPQRAFSQTHLFAHETVRSKFADYLSQIGVNDKTNILELGCGTGELTRFLLPLTNNIVGLDISSEPLAQFMRLGLKWVLADATHIPFPDNAFDIIIASAILHHLNKEQLGQCLKECYRVTRQSIFALEPNLFHPSGILMNIANTVKPGITGLVPTERALSPIHLTKAFLDAGFNAVGITTASYVWNRLPLKVNQMIARHEDAIRYRQPFNQMGWFSIVSGKKFVLQTKLQQPQQEAH